MPLNEKALHSLGIRLVSIRHKYREMIEEVDKSAPAMKRLLGALDDGLEAAKMAETVVANYSMAAYPESRWPKTFAFWRTDLRRIDIEK